MATTTQRAARQTARIHVGADVRGGTRNGGVGGNAGITSQTSSGSNGGGEDTGRTPSDGNGRGEGTSRAPSSSNGGGDDASLASSGDGGSRRSWRTSTK